MANDITQNTTAADDTAPALSTVDALAAAVTSKAARAVLAVLAAAVVIGALVGAGAAVFDLQSRFMAMPAIVAAFNAALVAIMPLALALGAAQSTRTRTHAAMVIWLGVWAVTALTLAALDGVLSASAIVADVSALTGIGRVMAPLPGALAAVTVAVIVPTLRGDDDAGAMGGLAAMIAKGAVILFSSAGMLNLAANSPNVREQLYVVALAIVVELSFVALLIKRERGALATALLGVLAVVLGLNAAESASVAFGFALPDGLAWLPMAGRVSVMLSGAVCVFVAVALSVASGKRAAAGPSVADWLAARMVDVRNVRESIAAAIPAPALPGQRVGAVQLAAAEDDIAATIAPARAEVAPRTRKSRRG